MGDVRCPLLINGRGGNVGINTSNPTSPLTVAGVIYSTAGGIMFPDGSVQTTAGSSKQMCTKIIETQATLTPPANMTINYFIIGGGGGGGGLVTLTYQASACTL